MNKTFEISYKLRYGETEDWGREYLKAATKKQALTSFANKMKIRIKQFKSFEDWMWEEGVWSARFKHIKQIKEKRCPHCDGSGIIHIQNMIWTQRQEKNDDFMKAYSPIINKFTFPSKISLSFQIEK